MYLVVCSSINTSMKRSTSFIYSFRFTILAKAYFMGKYIRTTHVWIIS